MDRQEAAEQLVRQGVFDPQQVQSDAFLNRMTACRASTPVFAKAFCPRWVEGPMIPQRLENFARLDDDTIPYGGTLATRTFNKTTAAKLNLIKDACFKRIKFVVWASSTLELAEQETENIRQEILGNEEINAVFRSMKPMPYKGMNLTFSKAAFYLADPATEKPFCFFLPRGIGQTCNGLIINIAGKPWRPTRLYLDDGEARDQVDDEDYRRAVREWLFGTYLPCVSDLRPSGRRWTKEQVDSGVTWRAWVSDTYKHNDCLMQHLSTDPAWDVGVYPKVKPVPTENPKVFKWVTAMPEIYTQAQAEQEMADYDSRGMLSRYMKEFGCRGTADLQSCWVEDYFDYYSDMGMGVNRRSDILKFIIIDPARSTNPWADYTAMLAVGWDTRDGNVLLRKEYADKVDTPAFLDALVDMVITTNTRELWIETTGNEGLPYTIKQHFMRLKRPVKVNTITAKTIPGDWGDGDDARKIALGGQILPWYKAKFRFVKHDHSLRKGRTEACMLSYPECKHWDPMDCAGYIPLVAKEKKLVMMPTLGMDKEDDQPPQFERSEEWHKQAVLLQNGAYRPLQYPKYGGR